MPEREKTLYVSVVDGDVEVVCRVTAVQCDEGCVRVDDVLAVCGVEITKSYAAGASIEGRLQRIIGKIAWLAYDAEHEGAMHARCVKEFSDD